METIDASGPNPSLHSQTDKFLENNKKARTSPVTTTPRVFCISGDENSFGRGVALTSTSVHRRLVRESPLWTVCTHIPVFKRVCLHLCVCVLKRAEWLRQRWRRELIRNLCLCFLCLGLVLEMKGSGGGGVGAGA